MLFQPIEPNEMGYDSDNEDNMYWVSDETKKVTLLSVLFYCLSLAVQNDS